MREEAVYSFGKRPLRTTIKSSSLSLIGIPKKFHNVTIDDFKMYSADLILVRKYVEEYIKIIDFKFTASEGICFFGSNGTGKTMLSCIILKEAYRHRYSCRRITFSQYVSLYTDIWNYKGVDKSEAEETLFKFKDAEFLVLEEIGKEIDTSVVVPILEDLLRYREDNGLVTIICMNISPNTLRETYGESVYSLITGNTYPVQIVAEDYRSIAFKERIEENEKDSKK